MTTTAFRFAGKDCPSNGKKDRYFCASALKGGHRDPNLKLLVEAYQETGGIELNVSDVRIHELMLFLQWL